MGDNLQKKLASAQDRWASSKEEMPGPPAGTYQFRLQECRVEESQSTGKLYIRRVHLIIDGEYANETVSDNLQLETENGPYFCNQFFKALGYEGAPDDMTQLPEAIQQVVDDSPVYLGKLTKDNGFNNVRIQKRLEDDSPVPARGSDAKANAKKTSAPKKASGDKWDAMDRAALKSYVIENELDITIKKDTTDDEIREALRNGDNPPEPQGDDGGDGDEFDAMDRSQLKAYIVENELDVTVKKDTSEDDIRSAIRAAVQPAPAASKKTVPAKKSAPAKKGGNDAEKLEELKAFCAAAGLKPASDLSLEDLIKEIDSYSWERDQLTDIEIALLESVGISPVAATPAKKK